MAELPANAPPATQTPEPVPEPVVELIPEPEPEPSLPAVTVTGLVVNLRQGPGTDHATATMQALADVSPIETEVEAIPEPKPAVATLTPAVEPPPTAVEPVPEPESRVPQPPADCTRLHTVNPNETQVSQITDWFGLDLQTVAILNGLVPDAPLTAGWQICQPDAGAVPPPAAGPDLLPVDTGPPAGAPAACPNALDFPQWSRPNAPIGQKVVDSPFNLLWYAPGTYDRNLPGLAYDFELVLGDVSTMWNWTVRDFDACYDAVRVHMEDIPGRRVWSDWKCAWPIPSMTPIALAG